MYNMIVLTTAKYVYMYCEKQQMCMQRDLLQAITFEKAVLEYPKAIFNSEVVCVESNIPLQSIGVR